MTLVVARRNEGDGHIYMVGDTKFTPVFFDGRDGQSDFIGGLKIVALHPCLAIAFAGSTVNARRAIENIHTCGVNIFDKKAVLDYFLSHHLRSLEQGDDAMVEFIAAFELNDQTSELFLVKNEEVKYVDAGYIGSSIAYNCFLHHEHQLAPMSPTPSSLANVMQALEAVIRDSDLALQDVDGFTIGLRQSANEGFRYVQRVTVEGRPTPISNAPLAPMTFGGAPEGANEWSIGSSPGDRYGVLTAYCHTGSFGVIYCPALSFTPRIVLNCTAMDLVNASMLEVNQIITLLEKF
jgi:hypothetical protein